MPDCKPSTSAAWIGRLICIAAVAALPLGVALAAQSAPAADGPVAAVFPPWWSAPRVFAAAGRAGPVVRFGAARFVVIVQAADRARLRAGGAWLLLDPAVLGGCATSRPQDPAQPDRTTVASGDGPVR